MVPQVSSPRPRKWLRKVLVGLGSLVLLVWAACTLSPWPGAWAVRWLFDSDQQRTDALLTAFAPPGIRTIADVHYLPNDPDAVLNVYLPQGLARDTALPVVVWTHGGGWLYGSHRDNAGYLELLASKGYVVVSVNYSLAPAAHYPVPVHQINAALGYLQQHAAQFHADMGRVFMAGDSAGGQLTAQLAALVTDPAYAAALQVRPALTAAQLRGLILHCGIYDLQVFNERAANAGGVIGWGSRNLVWSYTGLRSPSPALLQEMSPLAHVTRTYPPVFISGGNGDPLTQHQTRPLAARLVQLGVPVDSLFFPADHTPALGHEYQFKLGTPEAQEALQRTLSFLARYAGPPL